ncbi:hypothetical protein GCM10027203_11850 [Nonomuraea fastidiosa]
MSHQAITKGMGKSLPTPSGKIAGRLEPPKPASRPARLPSSPPIPPAARSLNRANAHEAEPQPNEPPHGRAELVGTLSRPQSPRLRRQAP